MAIKNFDPTTLKNNQDNIENILPEQICMEKDQELK